MGWTTAKGSRDIGWAAVGGITAKGSAGALESSPSPKLADGEPAVMVVTVPSQKSDAQNSDAAVSGPNHMALRAELGGTMALGSAWLERAVSDRRGPFMVFGKVRIRFWYVCFGGRLDPCGIMTTDERFKYDWNVSPVRTHCCAKNANHIYQHTWKVIIQIRALGDEFLTTMDAPIWKTHQLMYHGILKEAENTRYSARLVTEAIEDVRKFKFEQVFRGAVTGETLSCVDLEKTWFLRPNIQLPDWSFDLLYGVVKHCRYT